MTSPDRTTDVGTDLAATRRERDAAERHVGEYRAALREIVGAYDLCLGLCVAIDGARNLLEATG